MQLSTSSFHATQGQIGAVRPRLYTRDEIAEELQVGVGVVNHLITDFNIQPVFNKRPYKFAIKNFKDAINEKQGACIYEIEKDIPVMSKKSEAQTRANTLVLLMEIGNSILIPASERQNFYTAARKLKYVSSFRTSECKQFCRMWRTA